MRVSKEQAAQNRQDMLSAAARLFREQGISATGVDAITKEAGLTHGGLYSQFGSKEAIAAAAIRQAFAGSKRLWQRLVERKGIKQALPVIVAEYLSREHRDSPGQGCIVAALGADVARQPESVRDAFTEEFKDALACLAGVMPGDDPARRYADAMAAFAAMAGALMLARAVNDETLSEQILQTTAERVGALATDRKPARRS